MQGEEPTEIVETMYGDISGTPGPSMASNCREPSTINDATSSCQRSAEQRARGRERARQEVDRQFEAVNNRTVALSPGAHLGLAIEPFVAATPGHMRGYLYWPENKCVAYISKLQ